MSIKTKVCSKCRLCVEVITGSEPDSIFGIRNDKAPITFASRWHSHCKKCVAKARLDKLARTTVGTGICAYKKCSKCDVNGNTEEVLNETFGVQHPNFDISLKSRWNSRCRECVKRYKLSWYNQNADRLAKKSKARYEANSKFYKQKQSDYVLASSPNPEALLRRRAIQKLDPVHRFIHDRFNQWKVAAKKRSLSFSLEEQDMVSLYHKQNGLCHYTGRKLVLQRNNQDSLSLDRVNSDLGYSLDNVVLCGTNVNRAKLDMTLGDFKRLLEDTLAHSGHWFR